MRGCETCHSVRSIHNTQFDFAITRILSGFGHIGSDKPLDPVNNSWDCKGCHGYNANVVNTFAGSIIPDVQLVTPGVLDANTPTVLTLTGTNFVQTGSTTVVNIDDTVTLMPNTISNGQITVTVNLAAGNHYIKVIKTDPVENVPKPSDIRPLTVVRRVKIISATLNKFGVITIVGSGFGVIPMINAQQYITVKHAGNVYYSDSIIAGRWNNFLIQTKKTSTPSAGIGDIVTVVTANGDEESATIR